MSGATRIVEVELTPDEDQRLEAAAERLELTREDAARLLLAAALFRLDDRDIMTRLGDEDYVRLLAELDAPAEPNEALRSLMSTPSILEG